MLNNVAYTLLWDKGFKIRLQEAPKCPQEGATDKIQILPNIF